MSKPLNVLYQSSDLYSLVTGISLTSLFENNKDLETINVFIINDEISEENLIKFESLSTLYNRKIVFIDAKLLNMKLESSGIPKWKGRYTPYYKLIAFGEVDFQTDELLVLDSDTIVDKSLSDLQKVNLNDSLSLAVYDCLLNDYKFNIGISKFDKYYNTGVLYFNVKKWKNHNYTNRVLEHLFNIRSSYVIADQDIINVLFRKEIGALDLRYNFNPAFYIYGVRNTLSIYNLREEYYYNVKQIEFAINNVTIYHCMGAMSGRPWEQNNTHPQNELFDSYQKISPWRNVEKIKSAKSVLYIVQEKLFKYLPKPIYSLIHRIVLKVDLHYKNKSLMKKSNS